jgi:hypothetical protein
LLRREGLVSQALVESTLARRHTGFSAHNNVRLRAGDAAGRRRLVKYMLRAPFSLQKMSYDPASCTVIYRSRMHKTLKRNFQLMHGADWLVQLRTSPIASSTSRVIALIDDAAVIRKILTHLGLWTPQTATGSGPGPPAPYPPRPAAQVLTYHSVPTSPEIRGARTGLALSRQCIARPPPGG